MDIEVISPQNGQCVCLHTDIQRGFLHWGGNKGKNVSVDYLNLIKQREERTYPMSVEIQWSPSFGENKDLLLHLSEKSDFSEYKVYKTSENKAIIQNLKIAQKYFWRLSYADDLSDTFFFETADMPPRWIYAEGLGNIRDIGGWTGKNGKKVKQGMLYRGCEMEFHYAITDEGRYVLSDELCIKTDLDLRGEALGKIERSEIGEKCTLSLIPCAAYSDFMQDKEICKKIFSLLSDASNYPVYLHCWGGADRTGTVVFLLSAILGVKREDLFLDYEITSLSTWGERSSDSEQFRSFLSILDEYGRNDDSVNEKCEQFLLSTGITEQQIDNIRKIFLG